MEITLLWLLPVYLLIVLVLGVAVAVNVYHIIRFGTADTKNTFVVAVIVMVMAATFIASGVYFATVDWGQTLSATLPSITIPDLPQL